MSDEYEELDLYDVEVDEQTGEVKKVPLPAEPVDAPKKIKGSVSLVKDYQACPAKAYGRITRQKQTKGVALVMGIAVHSGLEGYTQEDRDPIPVFISAFKEEADRNELPQGKDYDDGMRNGLACVSAGKAILDKVDPFNRKTLKQNIKPENVERYFLVMRGTRTFTGKIDAIRMYDPGDPRGTYAIVDWKTGKNAPAAMELKSDLQFSMYPWACKLDPKLPTFGIWASALVYMHLRGKSVEKTAAGTTSRKKDAKKQYDFPTSRTEEQVERDFVQTIDPIMEQMESGIWYRNQGKNCSWCGFFNKENLRCEVQIPSDGNQLSLLSDAEVQGSIKAQLKPYSENG